MVTTLARSTPLALLLLLGACSGKTDTQADAPPVALVKLAHAQTGNVTQSVAVYGMSDPGADGTTTLTAPVEAIVASIQRPIGSPVSAGDIIVSLKPSPTTQSDMIKAQADARAADAALARAKRLRADNLVADADVETASAAAQAADALLASVTARAQSLQVRAQQAGFVVAITAKPGDLVAAGASLGTVTRTGHLQARFGIDPSLASQVEMGTPVRVTTARGVVNATILSVSPVVDPQTRLASVLAALPDGSSLGPGEPIHADIAVHSDAQALTIPYAALLDDGGQPYVYVVKSGVAHRADVRIGAQAGDNIAVLDGLKAGDMVVTVGGTALDDGMKVRTK